MVGSGMKPVESKERGNSDEFGSSNVKTGKGDETPVSKQSAEFPAELLQASDDHERV